MKPKLLVMVGVPGSGKSTYARKLAIEHEAVIISGDVVRIEMFDVIYDANKNGEVFEEVFRRISRLLSKNINVIFDACNVTENIRKAIFLNVKNLENVEVIALVSKLDLQEALIRNNKRAIKVPTEVITKMYEDYQEVRKEEGFNQITYFE
jgi:predicted kinase